MRKLQILTAEPYEMYIGGGELINAGKYIREKFGCIQIAVVSEDIVYPLYGKQLEESLAVAGLEYVVHVFKAGEASKNMETLCGILDTLSRSQLTRSDIVLALGGGVTGDIAGFASAVYLRGIRCVQIPTSYLAAVDSSTGGKTAVDLPAGKNLAGAFHMPSLVVCDTKTFDTLPKETFNDGVAETIKHAMIADSDLFSFLENNEINENIDMIVSKNVQIKTSFVLGDEKDKGKRQMLNFGHTIGHAAEKLSHYKLTHGSAVAIGMAAVLRAQEKLGIGKKGMLERLLMLLNKYSLPDRCEFTASELASAAMQDKKRAGDSINLVYLESIGKAGLMKKSVSELEDFIRLGIE